MMNRGSILLAGVLCAGALPVQAQAPIVMDGHVHVMSRQLLEGSDIGQRYANGHVDLPRAREGGVQAMFFSLYTSASKRDVHDK